MTEEQRLNFQSDIIACEESAKWLAKQQPSYSGLRWYIATDFGAAKVEDVWLDHYTYAAGFQFSRAALGYIQLGITKPVALNPDTNLVYFVLSYGYMRELTRQELILYRLQGII